MSQLELRGPKQILTLEFSPCCLTCSGPACEIAIQNSHPAKNLTHIGTGQGEVCNAEQEVQKQRQVSKEWRTADMSAT